MSDAALRDAAASFRAATAALAARRELRAANAAPARPAEDALRALDSSMKRNTALVKKLRATGEEARAALLTDVAKTNQGKYVAEAAAAVAESPLRPRDLPAAIAVCSALHQRYADFAPALAPPLQRAARGEGGEAPARRRAALRALVELLRVGVLGAPAAAALFAAARLLAGADFHAERDAALAALALMASFVKAGREDVFGLPSAAPPAPLPADLAERAAAGDAAAAAAAAAAAEHAAEAAQAWALPAEARGQFRAAAAALLAAAAETLKAAHAAIAARERNNEHVLLTKGDLPEALAARQEAAREAFAALQAGAGALAEALGAELPPLTIERDEEEDDSSAGAAGAAGAPSLFDDEDDRAFYEVLPDLRASIPAVLLGDAAAPPPVAADADANAADAGAGGDAAEGEGAAAAAEGGEEGDELPPDDEADLEAALAALAVEDADAGDDAAAAEAADTAMADTAADASASEDAAAAAAARDAAGGTAVGGSRLDAVLARLPAAVSRELCDELAADFCYAGGAARAARRRAAEALCRLPPGALSLVPCYARVATVLAAVFPDVGEAVVAHVRAQFLGLGRVPVGEAGPRLLEARLRAARYAGELVKFRLMPAGAYFIMLRSTFPDFSGHSIDAACELVECAGRALARRPDARERMERFLGIMLKLAAARNLDARHAALVAAAAWEVRRPVGRGAPPRRVRPPARAFARAQLRDMLAPADVAPALRRLRKLDFAADGGWLLRAILRTARKGRAAQLPLLASLAAGLARYQPALGVALVDAVLEEVAAGLEAPEAALYQRRVAAARLLGELYAFKLANSGAVFGTLRLLLAPAEPAVDPPGSFFRLRLVAALLGACGAFFARGAGRRRLDELLPHLARYVMAKPPLPLDVELDLADLYARLDAAPPAYATLEEACAAVDALEARAAAAAAAGALAAIEEDEEEDGDGDEDADEESGSESGSGSESDEGESSGGSSGSDPDSDDDGSSSGSESGSESESSDGEARRPAGRTEAEDAFDSELAAALGDASRSLPPPAAAPAETLAFRVMLRRGGGRADRTAAALAIPVPAAVAAGRREQAEREAAERAQVKRAVLATDLSALEAPDGAAPDTHYREAAAAAAAGGAAEGGDARGEAGGRGGRRGGRGRGAGGRSPAPARGGGSAAKRW
jgi:regulator of nonsense transcripts 2